MMRGLDNLWYRLLYTARKAKAKARGEAVRRFRQELAWQKPHLN